MKRLHPFTAVIEREGDGYVALRPELDIASQGDIIDEARANLVEALELFFETADPSEVEGRLHCPDPGAASMRRLLDRRGRWENSETRARDGCR